LGEAGGGDALVAELKSALQACARFAKQIVAQDAAGRRPWGHGTGARQTALGLIAAAMASVAKARGKTTALFGCTQLILYQYPG